jgi:hypothetical protein
MKAKTKKRPRGRPTKLTPGVQRRVCALVARGLDRGQVAAIVGIHRDTLATWLADFHDFSGMVKKAEVRGLEQRLHRVEKAGKRGDWRADTWYVERRDPDRWSLRAFVKQEVTGPGGQPLQVQTVKEGPPLADVVRSEVLAELEQRLKTRDSVSVLEVAFDYFTHKVEAARALTGGAGPIDGSAYALKLRVRFAYIGKLQRLVFCAERLGGHDLTAAQILDAVRGTMPPEKPRAAVTVGTPEPTGPKAPAKVSKTDVIL